MEQLAAYMFRVEQYYSLWLYPSDLSCQPKALVCGGDYHVIITTNIHWSEWPITEGMCREVH